MFSASCREQTAAAVCGNPSCSLALCLPHLGLLTSPTEVAKAEQQAAQPLQDKFLYCQVGYWLWNFQKARATPVSFATSTNLSTGWLLKKRLAVIYRAFDFSAGACLSCHALLICRFSHTLPLLSRHHLVKALSDVQQSCLVIAACRNGGKQLL